MQINVSCLLREHQLGQVNVYPHTLSSVSAEAGKVCVLAYRLRDKRLKAFLSVHLFTHTWPCGHCRWGVFQKRHNKKRCRSGQSGARPNAEAGSPISLEGI